MVFKRFFSGEKENGNQQPPSSQQRNQRLKYTRCLSKDRICRLQSCSTQLETLIRKVVREEVEQVIQQSHYSHHSISRSLPIDAKPCESRKFKLQFEGKFPQKLFTGNKVEAEGSAAIKLFLLDAVTGHRVTDGPLSSTKVKFVALHGHFRAEEQDIWTKKEFNKNIVNERDGKRPLLVGQNVVIVLENGVGCVGDVCFTDNSSWERSKMFRLGAKVEAKEDHVMEAVSTPFEVKDRRGENYQKHNIPSLEDEVWRLCWIAKDGKICKRLAEHQIYKVKDFLTMYYLHESVLRQILKVSPKKWEAIIQQATSCLSGNTSRILCHSASSPNDMPNCINPDLNLQQFCLPTTCDGTIADQQDFIMSHPLKEEQTCQVDQCLTLNNPILTDFLPGSYSDDVNLSSWNESMLPSFVDFEASSCCPIAQSEGNDYCTSLSYDSDTGMLSSIPTFGVNASAMAKPKDSWGKVRALRKILVKHNEAAIRKGKFPCYCQ